MKLLENTIKKIVEIDVEAENFRKTMDQELEKKKKDLNLVLQSMKEESIKKINEGKKSVMEGKLQEADKLKSQITLEKEESLKNLKENYNENKDEMVEELFNELFRLR